MVEPTEAAVPRRDGGSGADAAGVIRPELLHRLLPFLAEAVVVYDRSGRMTARVAPPGGILGFGDELGSSSGIRYHPDDLPTAMAIAVALEETEPGWHGRWHARLRHADGGFRPYEIRLTNCTDDPELDGFVACIREAVDATMPTAPEDLDHDERTGSLVESLPTAHVVVNKLGRIHLANEAARTLLGVDVDEIVDARFTDLGSGDDATVLQGCLADLAADVGERVVVFTAGGLARSGAVVEARFVAQGRAGRTSVIHGSLRDVSSDHQLVRLAMRDSLTGVANRARVVETLAGLVHLEVGVAVLFADLDGLKVVNDTFGHQAGDLVLTDVAEALAGVVRPADLVGRLGGDEFVIVCPGLTADDDVAALADRVGAEVGALAGPDGRPLRISVGWAVARPGETGQQVLARADAAMFVAKRDART
jgi:diguanylate cyclase (GGDEF)-like protein/PAS domain S-box-containing protein